MSTPDAVTRTKSLWVAVVELAAVAFLAVAVSALLVALGFGEAQGQEKPKKKRTRELVLRGQQFPDTLALVLDASGSMNGEGYAIAIREAMNIATQAGDAGKVRFFAFGASCDPEPQAWINLPDAEALLLAKIWLEMHGSGGGTDMESAMAFVLALPDEPLGVILFSDELPDSGPDNTAAAIHRANMARNSAAVIGVVGVNPPERPDGELSLGLLIAKPTGGAYIRNTVRKPTE